MSNKPFHDVDAVNRIIAEIDAAERKLRMIKQYVDPKSGTIRDTNLVAGLFNGAEDCLVNVRSDFIKFL